MKQMLFGKHALAQMSERAIAIATVRETLEHPDAVLEQPDGRTRAIALFKKQRKRYCIVVVCTETSEAYRIITVFITSKVRKYFTKP